ncbi:hypothetical protein D3C85_1578980 [compost metagenome]
MAAALRAKASTAAGGAAQVAEGGDVVGMGVAVDGQQQAQLQFAEQAQVVVQLVLDRVDQHGFAVVGQQVGIGRADAVEELAQEHFRLLPEVVARPAPG